VLHRNTATPAGDPELEMTAGRDAAAGVLMQRQSTGQVISDGVITAGVRASLMADPITNRYAIHVETFRAIVRLDGFVESDEVRVEALLIACDTEGVRQVSDRLDVRKGN
jgi:hyperosmotically inducible protein